MSTPVTNQPPAAAPAALDRKLKHLGTYHNFRGVATPGFLAWSADRKGFMAFESKSGKTFKDVAFQTLAELRKHNCRFDLSGKTEKLPEPKEAE